MTKTTRLAATSRASPSGQITGAMEATEKIVRRDEQQGNYPNPFN